MPQLTSLQTAADQIAQRIVDVTANPQPSYSIDGTSYSWTEYVTMLNQQLVQVNKTINQLSPYVITTKQVL